MAGLTRVPAPRSPFDRQVGRIRRVARRRHRRARGRTMGQHQAAARADAIAVPAHRRPHRRRPRARLQRTGARAALVPARSLRPRAGRRRPGRSGRRRERDEVPSVGLDDPADIASGPVVDLGPADDLDAIVISGPAGAGLDTIRLWRFDDGGRPERLDLARLDVALARPRGLGGRPARTRSRRRRRWRLAARPVSPRPARAAGGPTSGWSCSSVRSGGEPPTAPSRSRRATRARGRRRRADRAAAPAPRRGQPVDGRRRSSPAGHGRPPPGTAAWPRSGWPVAPSMAAGRSRSARRAPSA